MKKSIIILFVLLALGAKGQGNLQFNQVINLTAGGNYTVPAGKVLKIESITMSSGTICIPRTSSDQLFCGMMNMINTYGGYNSVDYMKIGDLVFNSGGASGYNDTDCRKWTNPDCWPIKTLDFSSVLKTPMWLKEGKSIFIYQCSIPILISAIEFNIVP